MPSEAAKKKAAAKKQAAQAKRGAASGCKMPAASGEVLDDTSMMVDKGLDKQFETMHIKHDVAVEATGLGEGLSVKDASSSSSSCSGIRITFPPTVTPGQRARLHELAEESDLNHASTGLTEASRHIVIWRDGENGRHISVPHGAGPGGAYSDYELAAVVGEHLGLKLQNRYLILAGSSANGRHSSANNTGKGVQRGAAKSAGASISLEEFVRKMLPLVDIEKEAEMAKTMESTAMMSPEKAQTRGRTLLNLKCVDAQAGLLGKTLLVLEPNRIDLLPPHKFSTHDVVNLRPNKGDPTGPTLGQGIVYRVRDNSITVVVDEAPEDGLDAPLRIEKVANEVTYRRLKDTLRDLSKGVTRGPASELVQVLFGSRAPTNSKKPVDFIPFNKALDHSQRAAISKALGAGSVMLLHGPPGTGKTTAVVEILLQEVKRGAKVLACAASNIAVDNVVERLARHKTKLVRLGHPARLLPQVLDSALDAQVMRADNSALAGDVAKEIRQASGKLLKTRDKREKAELRRELKRLAQEQRQRQAQAVMDVIKGADVILATLTGALSRQLDGIDFDLVVIDEAAQALECASWIPLLKGRRCILAGDHLQLPPTVQSAEAEKAGLGVTLFERITDLYGDAVTSMLTVQYRMNADIMRWSSDELYGGKVTAHSGVASHRLCELDGVTATLATEPTLILIDTAGCEMEESREEDGDSTANEGEARVAMAHARRLVDAHVPPNEIGIITPYSAQVGRLKELRGGDGRLAAVEISTVDGFQGREKDVIIISMVRSNEQGEVGFLADSRRMNVAVTRARRQCCVICNSETVNNDAFLKRMVEYFDEHGEYLSAMEYLA